ncbi:hypothetical protein [Halobacteriovorax sp. CON-3]|uniref:hypothetical protein n=1 Tax=Halobacteriovorax sp. CON-3 TaxID=3157710 RepID=UPI00371A6B17
MKKLLLSTLTTTLLLASCNSNESSTKLSTESSIDSIERVSSSSDKPAHSIANPEEISADFSNLVLKYGYSDSPNSLVCSKEKLSEGFKKSLSSMVIRKAERVAQAIIPALGIGCGTQEENDLKTYHKGHRNVIFSGSLSVKVPSFVEEVRSVRVGIADIADTRYINDVRKLNLFDTDNVARINDEIIINFDNKAMFVGTPLKEALIDNDLIIYIDDIVFKNNEGNFVSLKEVYFNNNSNIRVDYLDSIANQFVTLFYDNNQTFESISDHLGLGETMNINHYSNEIIEEAKEIMNSGHNYRSDEQTLYNFESFTKSKKRLIGFYPFSPYEIISGGNNYRKYPSWGHSKTELVLNMDDTDEAIVRFDLRSFDSEVSYPTKGRYYDVCELEYTRSVEYQKDHLPVDELLNKISVSINGKNLERDELKSSLLLDLDGEENERNYILKIKRNGNNKLYFKKHNKVEIKLLDPVRNISEDIEVLNTNCNNSDLEFFIKYDLDSVRNGDVFHTSGFELRTSKEKDYNRPIHNGY